MLSFILSLSPPHTPFPPLVPSCSLLHLRGACTRICAAYLAGCTGPQKQERSRGSDVRRGTWIAFWRYWWNSRRMEVFHLQTTPRDLRLRFKGEPRWHAPDCKVKSQACSWNQASQGSREPCTKITLFFYFFLSSFFLFFFSLFFFNNFFNLISIN